MPRPEVITYRYNGSYSYVPVAQDFEKGVELARSEFQELQYLETSRFSICVNALVHGNRQKIRIGPSAWDAVMDSLARYEVVDIMIRHPPPSAAPQIVVSDPDGLPEYSYDDVKEKLGKEKFLDPSRAPSPQKSSEPLPEFPASKLRTWDLPTPESHVARMQMARSGSQGSSSSRTSSKDSRDSKKSWAAKYLCGGRPQ